MNRHIVNRLTSITFMAIVALACGATVTPEKMLPLLKQANRFGQMVAKKSPQKLFCQTLM